MECEYKVKEDVFLKSLILVILIFFSLLLRSLCSWDFYNTRDFSISMIVLEELIPKERSWETKKRHKTGSVSRNNMHKKVNWQEKKRLRRKESIFIHLSSLLKRENKGVKTEKKCQGYLFPRLVVLYLALNSRTDFIHEHCSRSEKVTWFMHFRPLLLIHHWISLVPYRFLLFFILGFPFLVSCVLQCKGRRTFFFGEATSHFSYSLVSLPSVNLREKKCILLRCILFLMQMLQLMNLLTHLPFSF